ALPGFAGLALLLALTPKSVLDLSELEPVALVPPPPPPAGARFLLGAPEMFDVAILPDGERLALLTHAALEIRRWADLQVLQHWPADGHFARLAVSPTGDLVAGGGIVVDPDLGRIVRTYPRAWEEALAFDRTGTQLLVARRAQGAVRVTAYDPRAEATHWEAEFPLEPGHQDAKLLSVELSPDGSYVLLVLCTSGRTFTHIFELASRRAVRRLKGYGTFVTEKELLVFPIPEGDLERVGLEDEVRHRLLTLRALLPNQMRVRFTHCPLFRATLDREGRRAATAVDYQEAQVWDLREGRQVGVFSLVHQRGRTLRAHLGPFTAGFVFFPLSISLEINVGASRWLRGDAVLYLSPTGERLALLDPERLALVDLESKTVRTWESLEDAPFVWVWLPDGTGLVSEGMVVWDLRTGTVRRPMKKDFEFHNPVARATPRLLMSYRSFFKKGAAAELKEAVTELILWCPRTWRQKAKFEFQGHLYFAALEPDEDVAIFVLGHCAKPSSPPYTFSAAELSLIRGEMTPLLRLEEGERCLALSPSGRYVAVLREHRLLEVVELRSQRTVARWETAEPEEVQFSPDERHLALAYDVGVEIRSLYIAQQIWSAQEGLKGLAFHPKADVLAGVTKEDELVLWDFRSGQELVRLLPIPKLCRSYQEFGLCPSPRRVGSCVSFSPDGAWLSASTGPFIAVWPS
ncbi:MAG: hypothetical protein ABDI20_04465, partial [Candidatus Bipolaricaulaceae bacterium]